MIQIEVPKTNCTPRIGWLESGLRPTTDEWRLRNRICNCSTDRSGAVYSITIKLMTFDRMIHDRCYCASTRICDARTIKAVCGSNFCRGTSPGPFTPYKTYLEIIPVRVQVYGMPAYGSNGSGCATSTKHGRQEQQHVPRIGRHEEMDNQMFKAEIEIFVSLTLEHCRHPKEHTDDRNSQNTELKTQHGWGEECLQSGHDSREDKEMKKLYFMLKNMTANFIC